MKAAKLREMSDIELRQALEDSTRDLFGLRMKKVAGDTSEQPLRVRTMRREVARIKTLIKERGI